LPHPFVFVCYRKIVTLRPNAMFFLFFKHI
jgi:hypothetical protein